MGVNADRAIPTDFTICLLTGVPRTVRISIGLTGYQIQKRWCMADADSPSDT